MLFEMLWDRATSASIRIKQIQLGSEEEVFQLIRDELNIFYSTSEQEIPINRAQRIFAAIINELLNNGSKSRIKISILILTESHLKPSMQMLGFENYAYTLTFR
jgi:hypothetical protein